MIGTLASSLLRRVLESHRLPCAMLEMFVQDEPLRARYVMIEARIPASVRIERLSAADLPTHGESYALSGAASYKKPREPISTLLRRPVMQLDLFEHGHDIMLQSLPCCRSFETRCTTTTSPRNVAHASSWNC